IDPRHETLRWNQWPSRGRSIVWNPCRGNHLGQRSCASAPTGRTYGRKRSDQSTAKHLARRRPSTYGTLVAETILASVHVRAHRQAGHMDASDLIKALQNTLRG